MLARSNIISKACRGAAPPLVVIFGNDQRRCSPSFSGALCLRSHYPVGAWLSRGQPPLVVIFGNDQRRLASFLIKPLCFRSHETLGTIGGKLRAGRSVAPRPRPRRSSSAATERQPYAIHSLATLARCYRVPKGLPSGSYRVPSERSAALRFSPGGLHGRRLPYGSSPADSLPAGHCGAPLAPLLRRGASSRRRGYPRLAPCVACRPAPRACALAPCVAGRRAPCPRLARPLRLALCAAAGVASRRAAGLGGFAPAPRLPPNGSARFPAKAGSPPVRFGLRSRCAQPTQPAGSYRVPKGFPSFTCSLCSHCSWAPAHTYLHRQRKSHARNARTVRGLPPTPAYIGRESHVLAMLALFVGSRPHPLTSAGKVTCSQCSQCSWAPAHTRLRQQRKSRARYARTIRGLQPTPG